MPTEKRSPAAKPAHARTNFDDRISAAAAAKQALLDRFRARPTAGDPAWAEQQEALKAVADARDARNAERKAAKEAEAARVAAELAAQRTQQQIAAAEAKVRALALEAERKAARDARYAARKARK
jgi:Family of unknown function (DUF6481)